MKKSHYLPFTTVIYITAHRNTQPPNNFKTSKTIPKNFKYLHCFLLILYMLWVKYEVLLVWPKNNFWGIGGVLFSLLQLFPVHPMHCTKNWNFFFFFYVYLFIYLFILFYFFIASNTHTEKK